MKINYSAMHKKSPLNSLSLSAVLILFFTCSFSSQAINLTTYRIYLDNENRTESFIMFSRKNNPEQCSVKLKHFNFDENGEMTVYKGKKLPENSAKPWVRFSPKNFTVINGKPQTVRFSMRRKANTKPSEYRSYLSVYCEEVQPNNIEANNVSTSNRPKVSVKPMMVQNVPIIVRTGKLTTTGKFENIKVANKKVSGTLRREGDRSLYGRLALVNKNNNEEISSTSSISIYTETQKYAFELPIDTGLAAEDLLLRFTENENYGGTLIIEKSIK